MVEWDCKTYFTNECIKKSKYNIYHLSFNIYCFYRFSCRIVCDRDPPYTARIFAAGFDTSMNIILGVRKMF